MYSYEEGLKIAPDVTLVPYEEEPEEADEAASPATEQAEPAP